MTDTTMNASPATKTPWHLWVLGIVTLIWNGFGGYHYVMTQLQGETYMRAMGSTDAQIAHYTNMPAWMMGVWALGVWPALIGSILLLVRMKWAFHAFAISLLALIISAIYSFTMTDAAQTMGSAAVGMSVVVTGIAALLVWYAWAMTKRGVLR
ncbi:MAG: hypothetical protein ACK4Y4_08515 [Brevundimonas sp.]